MELKVSKDTVTAYGGRWETRLELPAETEMLIPDYLPAVFKIVKCRIEPAVLQNRVADGRWQCEGYLRCTVYYQSDEPGCRLYRTEQKLPFEKSVDLPEGTYADGPARLWGEPEYCNCRAVSEHRIDLRGAYMIGASVLAVQKQELIVSLASGGIEQRTQELHGLFCAAAEERTLTAEATLPLPGKGESILDIGGSFAAGDALTAAGQVNVQGTLQIQVCSQPADSDELAVRQKEIPVRRSLELPAAAEGDDCIVWGEVLSCTLAEGESSGEAALTVTWKLHLELWRAAVHTVAVDAYSTQCETQPETAVCRLMGRAPDPASRVAVAIEDDLPDADTTVKGCFATLGALTVAESGDGAVQLTGKGTAHVLCADARGEVTCYDKAFSWQPDGAWQGAAADVWPCFGAAVTRVSSGKNGARLRVELEIELTGALLQTHTAEGLCSVAAGEAYAVPADAPALYVYYAQQGERVFDIAKHYHARADALAAANRLEADGVPPQDLTTQSACLLIPAAR